MTAPVVDVKIHWLKMMSVPEGRAVVGRHEGINGRDSIDPELVTAVAGELQSFASLSKKISDVDKALGDQSTSLMRFAIVWVVRA